MLGITSRLETLPATNNGLDAVKQTLVKMVALVRKYRADVNVIATATGIIREGGISDTRGASRYQIIRLIQNWVRDRIGYAHDPKNVEMIQTPVQTMQRGYGDCDDKAILVCSLLEALGFDCEFLAVGGIGEGWNSDCEIDPVTGIPDYSHVLAAVRFGTPRGRLPPFMDGWLYLETIVPAASPGWFPPGVKVIMPAHI